MNKLIYGTAISKARKMGRNPFHFVNFYISENDISILQWLSPKKGFTRTRIHLKTVTGVSDIPTKSVGKHINKKSKTILAITYGKNQEMILNFPTEQDQLEWWYGLQFFIQMALEQLEAG